MNALGATVGRHSTTERKKGLGINKYSEEEGVVTARGSLAAEQGCLELDPDSRALELGLILLDSDSQGPALDWRSLVED